MRKVEILLIRDLATALILYILNCFEITNKPQAWVASQIFKGDSRTYDIFIPAWGSN